LQGKDDATLRALSIAAATIVVLRATFAAADEGVPSTREEVVVLQQRLTDSGCYKGAVDGQPSPELDAATKACPDQRPFLRIETGMHTAPIWRIGVDAACSLLATPSEDKTVRLWSLPEGKLKRTIRLPIADGAFGNFSAVALSPDGHTLAAGGFDASYKNLGYGSLSVIDLSSGEVRRYGNLSVINTIAFSLDGARIAVGLVEDGVRVFDAASGKELLSDRDYSDQILGLAFAPDGSLVASGEDGVVRRYASDLRLEMRLDIRRSGLGGEVPAGVAISPDGRRLAVGFMGQPQVLILDA
jgi:hypothetical protein